MLSLRIVLPAMPMVAALSADASRRAAPPAGAAPALHRPRQRPAGDAAAASLLGIARQRAGIEALVLTPTLDDFNDDLRRLGPEALAASLRRAARAGGRGALPGSGDRRPGRRPRQRRRRSPDARPSQSAAPRPSEGDRPAGGPAPQRLARGFLPLRGCAARAIPRETRKPCPPSSAALRPCATPGAGPVRPRLGDRQKAAMGAADPTKEHHHDDSTDDHRHPSPRHARIPDRASSSTSSRSTATAPTTTSPIRVRCPKPAKHRRRPRRHLRRAGRDALRHPPRARSARRCCGRSSTCSTAASTGSSASSMTTSRRSVAASASRTARRSARSSSSA